MKNNLNLTKSSYSPFIEKNAITRSFPTNKSESDSEGDEINEINISNNIKSKAFKKGFRFAPPPKKNFFKEKDEIIIRFIVCAAETKNKKEENKKGKNEIKANGKNREAGKENDKKEEKEDKTKKMAARCLLTMGAVLLLYYMHVSMTLVKGGIYKRPGSANLFKLSNILLLFHILLMILFFIKKP